MGATEGSLEFERSPDPDAVRIGRHWWRLEVSAEKIKDTIAPLRESVEKLKGLVMQPAKDRGPGDYDPQDDDIRRLASIIERLARPSYHNGGGDDSSDIKKWIVGVGVVLSGAFVVGGWTLSNQVASLTTKVDERMKAQDDRITRLEQQANERR